MRFLFLTLFCAIATTTVTASDNDWACNKIPEAIKKNANAIIRASHTEVNINSSTDIRVTERYTVTVLNKEGKSYAALRLTYDKFIDITAVRGWYYDEQGRQLTKIKKGDLDNFGLFTQNFYDDLRMMFIDYPKPTYPYTLEYEIETRYYTLLSVPAWTPKPGYDCAVEQADVVLVYPRNLALKYTTHNIAQQPVKRSPEQGVLSIAASVSNLSACEKPDELTPNRNFDGPALLFNINEFELAFIKGSLENWKTYGAFFYDLNKGRDSLPANVRSLVHQMTDTCATTQGKISVLYDYLKNNTRYLYIELGVGGWQTLEAKYVAEKGYGDCKALTNYMKALLAEAGIPAYQALVFGGRGRYRTMLPDFAYNAFNHVILCVPSAGDTTWLECTSKDLPAGYLSSFTDRRSALLLTPNGGFCVSTPANKPGDNRLTRKAIIEINDQNELAGLINATYSGYWWEVERGKIEAAKSVVDKYFNSKFAIPTYTAGNYSVTNITTSGIPFIHEDIPITGVASISRTPQGIFVSPQVLTLQIDQPVAEERADSFQLFRDYTVCDTTIIKLNGSYTATQLPRELNRDFAFASYHTRSFFEQDNTLKVVVNYTQKEGVYPPTLFADYLKLSKEINGGAAYGRVMLTRK